MVSTVVMISSLCARKIWAIVLLTAVNSAVTFQAHAIRDYCGVQETALRHALTTWVGSLLAQRGPPRSLPARHVGAEGHERNAM